MGKRESPVCRVACYNIHNVMSASETRYDLPIFIHSNCADLIQLAQRIDLEQQAI